MPNFSAIAANLAATNKILNSVAVSHAKGLIGAGRVEKSTNWDFNWSKDGPKLKENGGYAKWCLGKVANADPEKQGDWSFPISNDGKDVNKRGIAAAESRAAQQGYKEIAAAAKTLFDSIKG